MYNFLSFFYQPFGVKNYVRLLPGVRCLSWQLDLRTEREDWVKKQLIEVSHYRSSEVLTQVIKLNDTRVVRKWVALDERKKKKKFLSPHEWIVRGCHLAAACNKKTFLNLQSLIIPWVDGTLSIYVQIGNVLFSATVHSFKQPLRELI